MAIITYHTHRQDGRFSQDHPSSHLLPGALVRESRVPQVQESEAACRCSRQGSPRSDDPCREDRPDDPSREGEHHRGDNSQKLNRLAS